MTNLFSRVMDMFEAHIGIMTIVRLIIVCICIYVCIYVFINMCVWRINSQHGLDF